MKIKVWRDPYDEGFSITSKREIEINPGVTVLVGCNGAGKSTMLHNIEEICREQKIPHHIFDNLRDGNSSSIGAMLAGYQEYEGDSMALGACLWTASEGEAIKINVGRQSHLYKEFISSGRFKSRKNQLFEALSDKKEDDITDTRRVLLYDATDSGLSIDSVCDIKGLFNLILEDAQTLNKEVYIIIAANEYELCRGENCFDVNAGEYRTFYDYEDYREFILKSRKLKEKRLDNQEKWREKQKAKEQVEFEKIKANTEAKIKKVTDIAESEKRELTQREKWQIDDIKRDVKDFVRRARFNNFEYD